MSSTGNNSSSSGVGFFGVLTIVFVVLKLVGVIDWSWIYTGYVYEWLLADYAHDVVTQYYNPDTNFHHDEFTRFEILTKCDVLVDGEYKKELRDITLKWRGSSNQRVIDVQKSLTEGKVVLFCD